MMSLGTPTVCSQSYILSPKIGLRSLKKWTSQNRQANETSPTPTARTKVWYAVSAQLSSILCFFLKQVNSEVPFFGHQEELQLATIQVGTRKHEFFFHAINSLAHYLKRPVTYYVIVDDASLGYMEPLRKAFSHPLIKLVYIHKNTTKFDLSIDAFRGGGTGTFYKLFAQQIFPHHSKVKQ